MKRTVPLLITAISGLILIAAFFIPATQSWGERAAVWFDILASIAFILGGGNLLKLHLKKVSDKGEGWGYSGITVLAFIATLLFGLTKFGSRPAPDAESYGDSAVFFPVEELPEYRVDGTIPIRPDHEPLPASVRRQLREENGQLVFKGWLRRNQRSDLYSYDETLAWKCAVDTLMQKAKPPERLEMLDYRADQHVLLVPGFISSEVESEIRSFLGDSPPVKQAIDQLVKRSREPHSLMVGDVPQSLSIPEDAKDYVSLENKVLMIKGPMTIGLRESLAKDWCDFPILRPLSQEARLEFQAELESQGAPLSKAQQAAWDRLFTAQWNASQLISVINTAGIEVPGEKTACQLNDEFIAGERFLDKEIPASAPTKLNAKQEQVVQAFVESPAQSFEEMIENLSSAGEVSAGQQIAIDEFRQKLPTFAAFKKDLAFELLRAGALTRKQQAFLVTEAAEQFIWAQQIGRLFIASHHVRYPWSGDYSEQGSPFWWTYEYIFQPLLTTTFAMLAFYVASAAFRAFRAKNLEATLLLGTAFIILLGRTFAGAYLTGWIPDEFSAFKIDQLTIYIMSIFNTAGNRAIMIGIALGIASTSLKVLLGIDRSYLGSGDD